MTDSLRDNATQSPPRVSVVMATYNYGQYIAQAIQSVMKQTYTDWELLIVDDGSPDDTPEVVRPYLADPRLHYHRQENRGQPQAKNVGIRLSRGNLIAFLDADDAWLPTKLAKQVALFDADPELGVAYTSLQRMNAEGQLLSPKKRAMVRGHVLQEAFRRTIPPFSSSMVRREVFDEVGHFDESIPLAIDYDFWLRVALKYRFDYVDEPLLLYRTGHANLSRRSAERLNIVLNKIIPKILAIPGVRERLGERLIAEVYAALYQCLAREARKISLGQALLYHLRSLKTYPWKWQAWRNMLRCCVPNRLVLLLKNFRIRRLPSVNRS